MSEAKPQTINPQCLARITALISSLGSESFWSCLADLLSSVVAIDDFMVLLFIRGQAPAILHGRSTAAEIQLLEKHYIMGAYVLDPCYQAALKQQWGYYNFITIAPDGFYDSELYRFYYAQSTMLDEVGYLIESSDDSFINVAMSRLESSPEFNHQERLAFDELNCLVTTIVQEFSKQHVAALAGETIPLHVMMAEVLDLFGTSQLTGRETDVIHLILKGYSARSIAEHLEISINTVKLHRKNAYAKLDINSQNELFHLLIDSLSCIDENISRDPLETYFNSSASTAKSRK